MKPIYLASIFVGVASSLITFALTLSFLPTHSSRATVGEYAQAINRASASIVKVIASSPENLSLGSGVILDTKGILVTNYHVVANSTSIKVISTDDNLFEAKILGLDKDTDLAILYVDAPLIQAIPVAKSPPLVGDTVLAIGHPYEVGQTVTHGIISGLGRKNLGLATYENFIQTDAAINPGNSGGALINKQGELIGINTANFSEGSGSQGIGFAIPSEMAIGIVNEVLEFGHPQRGYLGVSVRLIDDLEKLSFNLSPDLNALLVIATAENSPADLSGLIPGDLILEINSMPVRNASNAHNLVGLSKPGHSLEMGIQRKNQHLTLKATLTQKPKAPQ